MAFHHSPLFASADPMAVATAATNELGADVDPICRARVAQHLADQMQALDEGRDPERDSAALVSDLTPWQIASLYLNFALWFAGQDEARHAGEIVQTALRVTMALATRLHTLDGDKALATATARIVADAQRAEQESQDASSSALTVLMNVRMVSGMMGEISRGAHSVGARVEETRIQATEALAETEQATMRVGELGATVGEIEKTAQIIRRIARQTNMLALNATIEAARAGEAGRGFAVVATEVKGLAKETAQATEEISAQLTAIRQSAQRVTDSTDAVRGTFGSIHDLVDGVAANLQEQDRTANQIAIYADEAAQSVEAIAATLDHMAAFATAAVQEVSAFQAHLSSGPLSSPTQVPGERQCH